MTPSGKKIKVAVRFLIFNDFNEVLLMRSEQEALDPDGNSIERWMTFGDWLEKGTSLDNFFVTKAKELLDMDLELVESLRPVEIIKKENGNIADHTVLLVYRMKPLSDLRGFGLAVKTVGWFTKQEIRWFWEKLTDETRTLLMATHYVKDKGET